MIKVQVDLRSVERSIQQIEEWVSAESDMLLGDVLTTIEQAQIKAYTSSGNPATDDERTGNLARASRRDDPKNGSARWWVDEAMAPYAKKVLGSLADQSPANRGRWKSVEQVEDEATRQIPQLAKKRFKGFRTK